LQNTAHSAREDAVHARVDGLALKKVFSLDGEVEARALLSIL
jgi:hypothetical protein